MIKLSQDQFEELKRVQNPEVLTQDQVSLWVINYSALIEKSISESTEGLEEIEKSAINDFDEEFKSFTSIMVIRPPKEEDLHKGLTYETLYIRERQFILDEDIITKGEDGEETIEKSKGGVYTNTEYNRKKNRVGVRFENQIV